MRAYVPQGQNILSLWHTRSGALLGGHDPKSWQMPRVCRYENKTYIACSERAHRQEFELEKLPSRANAYIDGCVLTGRSVRGHREFIFASAKIIPLFA
jgi:hypothetical protein